MSQACRVAVVLVALVCGFAAPAHAQEGARISGFYAGAIGEGETNVGAGGSVGYRFTPRFGFDFEALALPDFEIDDAGWRWPRRRVSHELRDGVSEPGRLAHALRAGRRRSRQHQVRIESTSSKIAMAGPSPCRARGRRGGSRPIVARRHASRARREWAIAKRVSPVGRRRRRLLDLARPRGRAEHHVHEVFRKREGHSISRASAHARVPVLGAPSPFQLGTASGVSDSKADGSNFQAASDRAKQTVGRTRLRQVHVAARAQGAYLLVVHGSAAERDDRYVSGVLVASSGGAPLPSRPRRAIRGRARRGRGSTTSRTQARLRRRRRRATRKPLPTDTSDIPRGNSCRRQRA